MKDFCCQRLTSKLVSNHKPMANTQKVTIEITAKEALAFYKFHSDFNQVVYTEAPTRAEVEIEKAGNRLSEKIHSAFTGKYGEKAFK